MEYTRLNNDIKRQILENKLASVEQEHYSLNINKNQLMAAKSVGGVDQAIAQLEASLVSLEEAHDFYRKEIDSL